MSGIDLFVTYPLGVHSGEDNFARTKNLFHRLKSIHPLLATFSPTGKGASYKGMLGEPLVEDLCFDQWQKYYQRVIKFEDRLPGHNDNGIDISYWNRVKPRPEYSILKITYDAFAGGWTNVLMLTDMAATFYEPATLDAIMAGCIESFDAYRAEYAWLDSSRDPKFRHYQLWMAEDLPFPTGTDLGRYQPNHPPPPISEPWHGGTRYTWPEHDPRILMQQYP